MKETTVNRQLLLTNNVSELLKMQAMLEELVADGLLPESLLMPVNLALEEALSNVMLYAYEPGTKGDILLTLRLDEDGLEILIVDKGKPFDPTQQSDPDTSLSVEDRPIGGLGIYLIRNIMDEVSYERVDTKNTLKLRKKLINTFIQ